MTKLEALSFHEPCPSSLVTSGTTRVSEDDDGNGGGGGDPATDRPQKTTSRRASFIANALALRTRVNNTFSVHNSTIGPPSSGYEEQVEGGGSFGRIYCSNAGMDNRERDQVLRSLTTLDKLGSCCNGQLAEAPPDLEEDPLLEIESESLNPATTSLDRRLNIATSSAPPSSGSSTRGEGKSSPGIPASAASLGNEGSSVTEQGRRTVVEGIGDCVGSEGKRRGAGGSGVAGNHASSPHSGSPPFLPHHAEDPPPKYGEHDASKKDPCEEEEEEEGGWEDKEENGGLAPRRHQAVAHEPRYRETVTDEEGGEDIKNVADGYVGSGIGIGQPVDRQRHSKEENMRQVRKLAAAGHATAADGEAKPDENPLKKYGDVSSNHQDCGPSMKDDEMWEERATGVGEGAGVTGLIGKGRRRRSLDEVDLVGQEDVIGWNEESRSGVHDQVGSSQAETSRTPSPRSQSEGGGGGEGTTASTTSASISTSPTRSGPKATVAETTANSPSLTRSNVTSEGKDQDQDLGHAKDEQEVIQGSSHRPRILDDAAATAAAAPSQPLPPSLSTSAGKSNPLRSMQQGSQAHFSTDSPPLITTDASIQKHQPSGQAYSRPQSCTPFSVPSKPASLDPHDDVTPAHSARAHLATTSSSVGDGSRSPRVSFDLPPTTEPFGKAPSIRSPLHSVTGQAEARNPSEPDTIQAHMQVESSPPPTSHFPAPSAGRRFSSSLARFGKSSTNLSKDYELSVSFARRGSDGRIGGKTSNSDLQSETSSSFFKNLGRPLSKGRKSVGSANGGLRDSMKKWASASTDALGVGVPGDRSRPGLGEAVALRQSLQIPRSGEPDVEYMVSPEGTPVASPSQNQTPRAQAPPSSARRMPRASFSLGRKSIDSLGRSMFGKSTDRLDAAGDASPKPGSSPRDTFARSRRSSATSIAKDFVKKTFGRKDRSSISSGSPGASPNASRFSRDGAFGSKESGLPTESEQERAREASKAFAAVFGAPIPGSMSRRASGNDAVPGASSSRRPSGVGPKLELPGKSQDGSSPQRSRPQFSREASNSSTAASFHSARDQHGSNMSLFTTVQWSEKSPFARQASPSRTTHAQAPCESLPPHQKNQSLEAPVQGTAPLLGGIAIDETQGWADSVLGESHGYGPSPNGSSLTGGTLPSTDTAISSAPSMSTSPSTAPTSADNGKVSATSILKEKEDGKDTTDPSLHIAAAPIAALADPNRRPSIGLHQEQDALEAGASPSTVVPAAPAPDSTSTTTTSHQRYVTATSDEPPPHRPQRSSRALSQLPRLNSLRAPPGGRMNQPGGRGGAEGSESRLLASGENESGDDGSSEDEQEMSEEDEDSEAEGEEGTDADGADEDPGFSVLDDTRTVDSSFGSSVTSTSSLSTDESFASAKDMASSAAVNARSSRPNDIILPPAPTFGTPPQPQAGTSASSTPSAREAVGRDSWTSFNSFPGFTPFETPTPKPLQMQGAAQTPKASEHENSYFSFRPRPPSRAGTLVGTNHDAPPPSPSVISRSRAPSSASQRTVRSIGSGQIPAPTPNRELPPMPPATLASLNIRGPHERSKLPPKSPRLAQSSHSSPFANGEGQPTPLPSRPTSSIQITPLSRAASVIDKGKQPERGASSPLANTSSASAQASPATRIVDLPWVAEDEATQVKGLGLGIMKPGDSSTLSTSSSSASRPALYQHKSKSLIDLSGASGRRMEFDAKVTVGIGADSKDPPTLAVSDLGGHRSEDATTAGEEKRLSNLLLPLPPLGASSAGGLKAWDQAPATPGLARRRSMFEIRTEPPPYSIIHRRPEGPQTIYPREEEGRERLPPYWCGVHIEGYLPRKMEFSAPGLQAKDRSWKRLYFVLHGTSLRVYKHDLSSTPLAQSGGWGELKGVHVHPEPMNEDGSTGGSGSSHSIGQAAREAISHSGLPLRHHNSSAINSPPGSELKSGLIRNYTLQNAESGLAADYLKRRHVVRVRAEGEQFLLQTRNDRHVVDWIEALQAATNVAMDLEKRQMPKFITLPRRRRRRRRNPDGTALTPAEQEERDLQEAQRRSMAEAQGGGRREEGSSGNGRARQSMSLENEMNPSAAFEEMLREEHEDMGSRAAADI